MHDRFKAIKLVGRIPGLGRLRELTARTSRHSIGGLCLAETVNTEFEIDRPDSLQSRIRTLAVERVSWSWPHFDFGRWDAYTTSGSSRKRLPVSTKSAFASAGAIGGVPGSPTPPGLRVLGTR